MVEHGAPVLDCAWAVDGRAVFCAGSDKTVKRWDLATSATTVVAVHDEAVRFCFDVLEVKLLATGSWDKPIKYWDVPSPTGSPAGTVALPDWVYAMDVRGPLMVVGLAERHIIVYDVRKPTERFQQKFSKLRYQTRCISAWPDSMGYVVGSVEGKVSVNNVLAEKVADDFVFRCHRDDAGGINAIRFHKQSGAFATAGLSRKV